MIEIYIHIEPLREKHQDIQTIVSFPIVPRIGEKVILSHLQKEDLLTQIREKELEYHIKKDGMVINWSEIMDDINIVSDVAYYAKDNSIHVELTLEE